MRRLYAAERKNPSISLGYFRWWSCGVLHPGPNGYTLFIYKPSTFLYSPVHETHKTQGGWRKVSATGLANPIAQLAEYNTHYSLASTVCRGSCLKLGNSRNSELWHCKSAAHSRSYAANKVFGTYSACYGNGVAADSQNSM